MTKHSDGPWRIVDHTEIRDAKGVIVCDLAPHVLLVNDEVLANAQLIAAAPRLLEMLERVAGDSICMKGFYEEFRADIRGAIRQAKGKA